MKQFFLIVIFGLVIINLGCDSNSEKHSNTMVEEEVSAVSVNLLGQKVMITEDSSHYIAFNVNIPITGRYRLVVFGSGSRSKNIWVEDYVHNTDGRTYNISGSLDLNENGRAMCEGSPLSAGNHPMKLHFHNAVKIDSVHFELMFEHKVTPKSLSQKMDGTEWALVWSDEFDGAGLPDSNNWNYNVGNWGWGNNEPQYYTNQRTENARQENGTLIIEARKDDLGYPWTSARITTQGKVSFQYGKIEFRAKVPVGRGTWSAGWLLGDAYRDEISWPYCGEIDVLETVGFEIDDASGNGINHATCHTRAYYFKQNNQIGSEIAVDSMNTKFHTYAIEWYPDVIYGLVDGKRYYTYDKHADELEWPFNSPQNIILNLAIGGGWGGAKGIDESYDRHQYQIDYVRVYEKR